MVLSRFLGPIKPWGLFTNMAGGCKWSLPVRFVNLQVIAAVPAKGAHYCVDVIGGLAVAFSALAPAQYPPALLLQQYCGNSKYARRCFGFDCRGFTEGLKMR